MDDRFNLRCSLSGHKQDVKDLVPVYEPHGAFITVSRDRTSKVWVPSDSDNTYQEGLELSGHESFVSCVCVLPPDSDYAQGLILTGGNDHKILAYTIDSPAPIFKLHGHTNTVCTLAAGKLGVFASGSWDHTARIWKKQEHIMTLTGHEASVCCVAILPGNKEVLTGSADKTLRLWNDGKVKQIFNGHSDCVRGVSIMDPNRFLSCSNDATVRLWLFSGECLQTFFGHTSYIYSVAYFGPNLEFASCGEDMTLKIWKGGECVQTIPHPSQSLWSVRALPNGDIATGGSDGVVRIFTKDPTKIADPLTIVEFEESVATVSAPAQIGDIKTDDLHGPEALNVPGRKEGQTIMIKRNNAIEAYSWSQLEEKWAKVGNVVGGDSTDAKEESFEGKYDHVFDVSLSEGQPMLKLPYNKGENPYSAAQRFIERNNLSPLFLDEVASFIQQQVGTVTLGENVSSYVDPYTGSSRYMAGNKSSSENQLPNSNEPKNGVKSESSYFPEKEFLKFENISVKGVVGKFDEFIKKAGDEMLKVNHIEKIISKKNEFPTEASCIMHDLLSSWSSELLFPVLDVLRYIVLDEAFCNAFISYKDPLEIIKSLCTLIRQPDNARNQFLTIRTICNMFQHEAGRKFILDNVDMLMESIGELKPVADKNLEIAVASFFVNISVVSCQLNDDSLKCSILSNMSQALSNAKDEEAVFRHSVAIGTLATNNDLCLAIIQSLSVDDCLKTYLSNHKASDKLTKCVKSLLLLLN